MLTVNGFGLGLITPVSLVSHRGLGETTCPEGMMLDTRFGDGNCIGNQYSYKITQSPQAYDYAGVPGCHVVDLSSNWCLNADGTDGGCNRMPECDKLTRANHFQYGLPGGPTNTGVPLHTGPLPYSSTIALPDANLTNPTNIPKTAFIPANSSVIQQQIDNSLGTALTKLFSNALISGNQNTAASSNNSNPASITNVANGGKNAITTNPNQTPDGMISTAKGLTSNDYTSVLGIPIPAGFLSNSMFLGIPNWALLGALGIGLVLMFKGK